MKKTTLLLLGLILIPMVTATQIKVYDDVNPYLVDETLNKFDIPEEVHTILVYDNRWSNCGYYSYGGKMLINMNGKCLSMEEGIGNGAGWIIQYLLSLI